MRLPLRLDFDQLDWQPHPTLAGVETKLVTNDADYSPADVLLARVAPEGEIPWHVHERQSEIAYIVQGRGVLFTADDANTESPTETSFSSGCTLVVPPGLWHRLKNTSGAPLLIFASHMA